MPSNPSEKRTFGTSSRSTPHSRPLSLFNQREDGAPFLEEERKPDPEPETTEVVAKKTDEDEAVVENATEKKEEKGEPVPTKRVTVDEWVQLNIQAPPRNR